MPRRAGAKAPSARRFLRRVVLESRHSANVPPGLRKDARRSSGYTRAMTNPASCTRVTGRSNPEKVMGRSRAALLGAALGVVAALAGVGCSDDESNGVPDSQSGGLNPGGSGGSSAGAAGQAGSSAAPGGTGGTAPATSSGGTEGTIPGDIPLGNAGTSAGSSAPEVDAGVQVDAGSTPPPVPTGFSPCPTDGTACRIMPLGDSITDGLVGVGPGNTQAANGGYRVELFRLANTDGHEVTFVGTRGPNGPNQVDGQPFPRDHEGISGDTIPGVAGRVDDAIAATSPDIVLLQIGTNHLYQGLPAGLTGQLGNLLDQITNDAPDALVVVAQITPLGASFPNNGVDEYNAAIPALVQERVDAGKHLLMVDMFDAISSSPTPLAQLVGDNIHPNAAGYVIMAQTWYAALESYLP